MCHQVCSFHLITSFHLTSIFSHPLRLPTNLHLSKCKALILNFVTTIEKLVIDDPRRIVHSFKVALAITLVSTVYYLKPLYKDMGDASLWAVMTSGGATLCKGMNRGLATLLGGALGIGAKYLASLSGPKAEPILSYMVTFKLKITAASATFSRFIPHIKKRYDYGVMIFILTFSLVAVSGYRVDKIIELAYQRLSTIIIGCATCIIISICVCPVWAGEDLNNLLFPIWKSCYRFGGQIPFEGDGVNSSNEPDKSSCLVAYKSVLNSKAAEESLANFAWWEPGHGKFGLYHPWKQYLKIGVASRQCGSHIEALNGYLDAKFSKLSEQAHFKMLLGDDEKPQVHHDGGAVACLDDHDNQEDNDLLK
ncbi:hypothetical protein E3N88_01321 [Mikania micrantha]|uniref:Aluminum-activated malate transporter n=1 Tax=Mikania micrantha TaxID=192012 RepID=A0A5N6Q0N2_9ASTR|nr:hypothetical protein E3N88_01321 [Mikania micrantha]